MVLTCSVRIPRVPTYSGYSPINKLFDYRAFTLSRSTFQSSSPKFVFSYGSPLPRTYCYIRFGLFRFRSPLLSESLFYFLFLRVIRWFSSPGSPRTTIDLSYDIAILLAMSFLIRTSAVIRSFAAHRGFSQLVTSFFGAMYQGILHTLFVAYSFQLHLCNSSNYLLFYLFRFRKFLTYVVCVSTLTVLIYSKNI